MKEGQPKMPMFSIAIPAKGRPEYSRDAVFSVMNQDFEDFEVIFSNNGADPAVKAAVADFIDDPRFVYVEQPAVLNMPVHWEVASRSLTGKYFLVLSNRSVLKQHVLRRLSDFLSERSEQVEAVSWGWADYDNASGRLTSTVPKAGGRRNRPSSDELHDFARRYALVDSNRVLPLGSNSCVSASLVHRIRAREGSIFKQISPDYRFAFSCLLNTESVVHFDEVFFITQGLEVSTGRNSFLGSSKADIDTLDATDLWRDVPIKVPLSFNEIAQDFLEALRDYGRDDIRASWDWSKYYKDCLMECRIKRKAGVLSEVEIDEIEEAIESALQNEPECVRAHVQESTRQKIVRKMRTALMVVMGAARNAHRRHLVSFEEEEPRFRSALEAAGFVSA